MKTLPYLALLSLLLTTCSKEQEETLPPATQVGANTFGCKVNGKIWIPNGGPGFGGPKPIEDGFESLILIDNSGMPYRKKVINLTASRKSGEVINFVVNNPAPGHYLINQTTPVRPFTTKPKDYGAFANGQGWFITNENNTGEIHITKADTISGIISGTFSFKAALHNDPSKTVEVTEGRFDINVFTR